MRYDKNNNDAIIHRLDKLGSNQALVFGLFSSKARHLSFKPRGCEFEPHLMHASLLTSLCRYQESLCPVEHMYFSDEKSITDEI